MKRDMAIVIGVKPSPRKQSASAPPPFGPSAAKPVQQPEPEPDETQAHEETEGRGVRPEAVCYRDERQKCANCEYMGADGTCSWLKIAVQPDASCNLFEDRAGGESEMSEGDEGIPPAA